MIKKRTEEYRYTITMAYLDQKRGKSTAIKNECVKYLIIDHNYENNCMPILYVSMSLDRKMLDDMILNCNDNLIMVALHKYNNLSNEKLEIECFRKRFTYFLPNDVSKTDELDYNDETLDRLGDTYKDVVFGLMSIDHINNNKRSFNFLYKNTTIAKPVEQVMSHFNNLVIEPISDPTVINQLMLPEKNSVSKALKALNNIRVLYSTPYRYYQDFNNTYLLSSSGRGIKKAGDLYNSIIFDIEEPLSSNANDIGIVINKSSQTYEIPISYANTQIYDNTIINKSQTSIVGRTSSGELKSQLKNKSSYSKDKNITVRLNNDNEGMIDNIAADKNNNNFFVHIQKNDLDTDVLTPNKRITINNISRYKEHNGDYLMYRKRECFIREDTSFLLSSMISLKEIGK